MRIIEPVKIQLDREREMKLSLGALAAAQRKINELRAPEPAKSIMFLIDKEMKGLSTFELSPDLILVLLWASLLDEDPDLTIEQVGKMATDIGDVVAKVLIVLSGAFFKANGDEQGDEPDEEKKSSKKNRSIGHQPGASDLST